MDSNTEKNIINGLSTIQSPKRCSESGCPGTAVTLSEYCFRHIKNRELWAQLLIKDMPEPSPDFNAFLFCVDLSGSNLRMLKLPGAELTRANIASSNLAQSDLSGANLTEASADHADFFGANLCNADFFSADMSGTLFTDADLRGAKFIEADLSNADLRGAKNLSEAFFHRARFENTKLTLDSLIPDGGKDFIIGEERVGDIAAAREVYRAMQANFEMQGQYSEADRVGYRIRKLQIKSLYNQAYFALDNLYPEQITGGGRKVNKKLYEKYGRFSRPKYMKYLAARFWDAFFGFGYKPQRLIWWSIAWVLLWFAANHIAVYHDSAYFNFRRAIYGFLGVGAYAPWVSFVFIEAVGGIFLTVSAIYCLLRKIIR